MEIILTTIGLLLLVLLSWFTLYILVFTVSLAWHKGVQKTKEEENMELKELALEMNRHCKQMTGRVEALLAAARDEEKPPVVH